MRWLYALLVFFAFGLLSACADKVEILNAAPRLTWVAVSPVDGGVVEVTLWVSDREGDPVDVDAQWLVDGEDSGTALVMAPGGHGTVGLTTDAALFDPNGEAHVIAWDVADVPAGGALRLRLVPDDLEAGEGRTVRSPSFTLATGLPVPVELEEVL